MSPAHDRRWKVQVRRSEFQGRPWLEVFRESIELPDGRVVDDFYSVEMQDFGVVAAITDRRQVVVERLYRHGPGRLTWSLPAGFVQEGESPLEATIRELREETGFEAREWTPLGRFVVDGNRGCGWCHCFLARGAHVVDVPTSDDLADVEVSLLEWARLIELLAAGEITELASAATLGMACIHLGGPEVDSRGRI
ncbi:MAG: NUDIX hydrolase [Candidatus Dormibacterales bacterium]